MFPVLLYTCETCGFDFEMAGGRFARWCADCRVESARRARKIRALSNIPTQRGKEQVDTGLASALSELRIQTRLAMACLGMAAWARSVGQDDSEYLDEAFAALASALPASSYLPIPVV